MKLFFFQFLAICLIQFIYAGPKRDISSINHIECKKDYVKIGCFNNQNHIFKDVLVTTVSKDHPQSAGIEADWNNFHQHLRSLACLCYERALKGGYKYFAIGNYETCYGAKDVSAFDKILKDVNQKSVQCLSGQWFEECTTDHNECTGEAESIYVYEFRAAIPTKPALLESLALNRPTSQSSTYSAGGYTYPSNLATDGNKNTQGNYGGCTHTKHEAKPSWKVTLASLFEIQQVKIYNRFDCCSGRLSDSIIYVEKNGDLQECAKIGNMNGIESKKFDCVEGVVGDAVVIVKQQSGPLSLCEVEVFGKEYTVDGGYSAWSEWTECDHTCGDGQQERERTCTEPEPSSKGKDCSVLGSSTEIRKCNLADCGIKVEKGKFLQKIAKIEKSYSFSVDIKPLGVVTGWSNIIRVTATAKDCCAGGDRIPALFFHTGTTKLHTCNNINGNGNYHINDPIPMGKFTNVRVQQTLQHDGNYRYSIFYDGKEMHSIINNKPKTYENALVYVGDKFYKPSNAVIRNFKFESPISPAYYEVKKNSYIKTIPKIEKTFLFSLNIKPMGVVSGWSNIIRVTSTTDNCCGLGGNRIPALFFSTQSTKLHTAYSISGNGNRYFDKDIPMGKFTNVKIQQEIQSDGKYRYSIAYDDKEVFSTINNSPRSYENAKVYIGDNFYPASNAVVENLEIQTPLKQNYYEVARNQFIQDIKIITKAYRFSLDIKPMGVVSGWSNIIRVASTTKNCCDKGNRIPALFFHTQSTKIHTCNYINGNGNFHVNVAIPMGKFTNVKIQQILQSDGTYRYSIAYDDKEIYSVINKTPKAFENAKVFIGDRFYNPSNAIVSNFKFENL